MVKITKKACSFLAVCFSLFAIVTYAMPSKAGQYDRSIYTIDEIVERLYDDGYYRIRVTDRNPPLFDLYACYEGKLFEFTIDHHGRIRDKDYEGRCPYRKRVEYHEPEGDVSVDLKSGVHVRAPYADVDVDKYNGVRVRAPFVDLHIRK